MGQTLIILYGVSGVLDVTGNTAIGITGEIEVHVNRCARSQAAKIDTRLAEASHGHQAHHGTCPLRSSG